MCQLNLSDSSTSSVEVDFVVSGSPIVSPDGSIVAMNQVWHGGSPFISTTRAHTYDAPNLQYRDEVYKYEGNLLMLGPGFRLTIDASDAFDGSLGPVLLPSSDMLDVGPREFIASESGKVLSARNPSSRDHVRFVTLPEGIVIGDVPEPPDSHDYRLISSDGEVAVIFNKIIRYKKFRFDFYNLSNRTNYTALVPDRCIAVTAFIECD